MKAILWRILYVLSGVLQVTGNSVSRTGVRLEKSLLAAFPLIR